MSCSQRQFQSDIYQNDTMASKKTKTLTLQERIEVIKLSYQGKTQREIAAQFCVSKSQIQNTLKRKADFQSDYESSSPLTKKRKSKTTGNEVINELTLKWFLDATSRRINVNGPMLQEKALQFATGLNIPTFCASKGWLQRFAKRNNLAYFGKCFYYKSCFKHQPEVDYNNEDTKHFSIQNEDNDESNNSVIGMSLSQQAEIEKELHTCGMKFVGDWNSSSEQLGLQSQLIGEDDIKVEVDIDSVEGEDTEQSSKATMTVKEGFATLSALREYLHQRCLTSALHRLDGIEDEMIKDREQMKQTSITQYFTKK